MSSRAALRGTVTAVIVTLAAFASPACAPRQVCQCAVYVGGTTPASAEEQQQRGESVDKCLREHGGGTIHGCPMPPSMAPTPALAPAPPSCPLQLPLSTSPCPIGVGRCVYAQSQCVCVDECLGGAKIAEDHISPPARWQCSPRPSIVREDCCSGEPPATGSPCTAAKTCSYGLAETGLCWGFTLACANQKWTRIPQAPPP
jgi:hypothetical protein